LILILKLVDPNEIGEIEWIDENILKGINNQLVIRDFGVGLSPERVRNYLWKLS